MAIKGIEEVLVSAKDKRKSVIVNRLSEDKQERLLVAIERQMELINNTDGFETDLLVYRDRVDEDIRNDLIGIFKSYGYGIQKDKISNTYKIHW